MTSLQNLTDFGKGLTPVVKDLIDTVEKAVKAGKPDDVSDEDALFAKLADLIADLPDAPNASVEERAGAIVALRTSLTDLLVQAATSNVALDENQVILLQAQRDALRSAFGRLLEITALTPLARILSKEDLTEMAADLKAARRGLQNKKTAKAVLDTVIDVAITAGKLAAKLAV